MHMYLAYELLSIYIYICICLLYEVHIRFRGIRKSDFYGDVGTYRILIDKGRIRVIRGLALKE